jgi:hypothetical protein
MSSKFLRAIRVQKKMREDYVDLRLSRVKTDKFSAGVPFRYILEEVGTERLVLQRLIGRTAWPDQSELR